MTWKRKGGIYTPGGEKNRRLAGQHVVYVEVGECGLGQHLEVLKNGRFAHRTRWHSGEGLAVRLLIMSLPRKQLKGLRHEEVAEES